MPVPENSAFMVAAYVITAVVVVVYAVGLFWRVRKLR